MTEFEKDIEKMLAKDDEINSPEYFKKVKECEYAVTEKEIKKKRGKK